MTSKATSCRRIGFLLFDGITALDVVGPMDAFASAACANASPHERTKGSYDLLLIGITQQDVVAESGLILKPQVSLSRCPELDTLVVPGGRGLRDPKTNKAISNWIASRASGFRRIASVCTGIYGVAPTNLLDGRKVATHWKFAADVSRRFPALRLDDDALFMRDGKFYTSAGITAGIDLSLALIEEDLGNKTAMRVARELVVYMRRSGGQAQYSEPLRFQCEATDELHQVDAYIRSRLDQDLSVAVLARSACLSERQFSRRFKCAYAVSPAAYVERLRLDEARTRLSETDCRINRLASALGFSSDDAFRRAFERRFGIAPSQYRLRFRSQGEEKILSDLDGSL
jgi:transcriptional regulator GlxA family with amidase domain